MSLIEAYFDGACEPKNPGEFAAYGALIKVDGETIWSDARLEGEGPKMSNNVAEYAGVVAILERISALPGAVVIRGDSKLVVNQLNGDWRARRGLYLPLYRKTKKLCRQQRKKRQGNLRFVWIPRDENAECDALSKQVLKVLGVRFVLQPEAV